MKIANRRRILKSGLSGLAGLASVSLMGSLVSCSQQASRLPSQMLSDRVSLITGAPGNIIALNTSEGMVLVDTGSAEMAASVQATLDGNPVKTVFNTHYHADQTGGNALFRSQGATLYAHEITRQWLSADYYVPAQDIWVPSPAVEAQPTETFRLRDEMTVGEETIEYAYLLEAHTRGDLYVFFKDSNILAVGDVASPLRDPELDWFAGGWLGGRVDAMDDLLALANPETIIVPAYGPVMSVAELQAERDMMIHLYERTTELTDAGHSAQDMLDVGLMNEIDRRFNDPYRFLYDVSKGLWAHYTNFGGNIV